jgi:hypothetical protein
MEVKGGRRQPQLDWLRDCPKFCSFAVLILQLLGAMLQATHKSGYPCSSRVPSLTHSLLLTGAFLSHMLHTQYFDPSCLFTKFQQISMHAPSISPSCLNTTKLSGLHLNIILVFRCPQSRVFLPLDGVNRIVPSHLAVHKMRHALPHDLHIFMAVGEHHFLVLRVYEAFRASPEDHLFFRCPQSRTGRSAPASRGSACWST